jgi:DNA-binding NarL/FixJ family response regulator
MTIKVLIFDDVVFARRETFHIPGLEVDVAGHADDCVALCTTEGHVPDVVFMDYAMGKARLNGAQAVSALRTAGYSGRIVGISSDPVANQEMIAAGANESLAKKAHMRSFLVHLASSAAQEE